MLKYNNYLITILLLITLISCFGLYHKHIVDRYFLVGGDTNMDMAVGYSVSEDSSAFVDVVGETVYAVGYNDKYIIVKRHPANNRNITTYYIIVINKEYTYFPEKTAIGPLTIEEFNNKREEMKIPKELKFTIVLENLK